MNSAVNSATQTSRPALWRRSKAYKRKLITRILLGAPVVSVLGWEYRVWKRKLYYDRNKHHFPGATPFYGKMWGYESDKMIEESLGEGDLVFWSVDPLSIHIPEAICRFAYRHLKGDYDSWDFCGILRMFGGRMHVVGPSGESALYSDLVADYRTRSLAVRKLVESGPEKVVRSGICNKVEVNPEQIHEYMNIGSQGFFELSLKAILVRLKAAKSSLGEFIMMSFLRPNNLWYPLDVIFDNQTHGERRFVELVDVIGDESLGGENFLYSPPFFVRRLDSEYYNHNRTRNVVVDWELLVQRDQKNRMVAGTR